MRLIDEGRQSEEFVVHSQRAPWHWGAAAMCLVFALYLYWDEGRLADLPDPAGRIPFLILCLALAVFALCWRRGVIITKSGDNESAVVRVQLWWGLCIPLCYRATEAAPLSVVLERAVIPDTNPTYVHTIFLLNERSPAQFVARFSDIVRAHAAAQQLAEFLDVEFQDCSAEAEFRVATFGFLRWNADRPRSRWYYAFDANGKPVLQNRDGEPT